MIRTGCLCPAVRHAVTDEHRDVLRRALATAEQLEQHDLADSYRYRLQACPTSDRVDLRKRPKQVAA